MSRKGSARFYIFLGVLLFSWIGMPKPAVDEMRYMTVASLAPAWGWAKKVQRYFSNRPERLWSEKKGEDKAALSQLSLENALLRSQVDKMTKWLSSEEKIEELLERAKKIEERKNLFPDKLERSFFERRLHHLLSIVRSELIALPAQVVYRDPSSWSSTLWVNVGEEDNRVLGSTLVAKNSPVVLGISLIGVVDFVGKKQSRVRLMTDSGFCPAVRAVRGGAQSREVVSAIDLLLECFDKVKEKEILTLELKHLKKEQEERKEEYYLAKGQLQGSSSPLWRSRNPLLKGVGFNFDYPDEDGSLQKNIPILKKGDLLVTTGFDGVFPPDLHVGIVSKVIDPKPGGYAYEIEVRPTADHLNHLETLFILPPRSD